MSYVVSIRRPDSAQITAEEFRLLVTQDDSFHPLGLEDGKSCVFEWLPPVGKNPVVFSFADGEVSVTTPSHAALKKMQALARSLNARVIGEEGEDLTEVAVPDRELPFAAIAWGCALAILLFGAGIWWFAAH
ncbi:MAG: hypothetical protein H6510_14700 [Acidobacteria bacterium]|nr:hypothetical protein [Acidobacteriota bacterium]MCB9399061.1 hypothetical protein [Acidobacteriota bacterium]